MRKRPLKCKRILNTYPDAEKTMRCIPYLLGRCSMKKNTPVGLDVSDETNYLLSSKANAERLLKSIENVRNRPTHPPDNHLHLPLINGQRWQQTNGFAPRDIDQQSMIPSCDQAQVADRLLEFDADH